MRELDASLQQFGEFILKAQLVKEKAAPYCVRWVRRFLTRPASDEPLADQVRRFCESVERDSGCQDWQVRQAEHALWIYFVNFLQRTDWNRRPASAVVDEDGRTNPLAALEQLRMRVRTRHYSYRTECSYADWVRRFLAYLAEREGTPRPRVDSESVRDYLTHLAMRQRVSANTQNQAMCAILFLCREVLGIEPEGLALTARAKRGSHLPAVLSVPETTALLGALRGAPALLRMLNWAVEREYLDRTPFRRGSQAVIKLERENNHRSRRLTADEETRLLHAARPITKALIIAALDTGMRRGELLSLRLGDVDVDRRVVHVRPENAKSKRGRSIPICDDAPRGSPEVAQNRRSR